jgi:hypothetical protein
LVKKTEGILGVKLCKLAYFHDFWYFYLSIPLL